MILNWLRRFMYGRYGTDQLDIALLVLYCIILVIARIFGLISLSILALAIVVYALFRMLSRNVAARSKENQKFLSVWYKIKGWFQKRKYRLNDRKTHRYYRCPGCKQTLRVPKGKGKIEITCPHCQRHFIKKT